MKVPVRSRVAAHTYTTRVTPPVIASRICRMRPSDDAAYSR